MSNLLSIYNTKSESFHHKAIKKLFFKYISNYNRGIAEKSLEKYIGNRRADVYFKLKNGKEIVIEVQSSKITVREIIERTEQYNSAGIYVLWILHANGACVASNKDSENKKDIKISIVENYLHRMYGGRVYYVNLNISKDNVTISHPFALHFSLSSNKKNHKMFRKKYDHYYIKNTNFAKISSWNLLCVNYNGFKLARFYDTNIKRVLKEKVITLYQRKLKTLKSEKKILKIILNHFKHKYGFYLILDVIFHLIQEKEISFHQKIIKKIQRKTSI
ncbi:MAG: competence protein CoiA family protein [Candidatus Thorarchaeota archaeon]